ncbi:MAG: hypothetical protein ACYDGR_13880 [Candidatus Dormibacteria bacterium]
MEVTELPPTIAVTVKLVMGAPPFDAGGIQPTVTWLSPGTALTPVGAPGGAAGVTGFVVVGGPLPAWFVAYT